MGDSAMAILTIQPPSQSIRVAPVDDYSGGEADNSDRAQNPAAERTRQDELETDHHDTEQQHMPGVPRVYVIPDGVVPKGRGHAESVDPVAWNPPEEQRNRHENEHGTNGGHAR